MQVKRVASGRWFLFIGRFVEAMTEMDKSRLVAMARKQAEASAPFSSSAVEWQKPPRVADASTQIAWG